MHGSVSNTLISTVAGSLLAGLLVMGCGGSGGGGSSGGTTSSGGTRTGTSGGSSGGSSPTVTLDPQEVGEAMLTATVAPLTATDVALQAALAHMVPGSFFPPTGVALVASGSPTAGTVLVDFGSGSLFNKLVWTGALHVSWTKTGDDSWTVTVDFHNFGMDSFLGASTLDGTLTVAVTVAGDVATTSVLGSVSHTSSSLLSGVSTMTVTLDVTTVVDGANDVTEVDGVVDVDTDSSLSGDWTASAADLVFADGDVASGEVALERRSFPSVTVTFTFTEPSEGTWRMDPPGVVGTFSL
jgi:hypothetical protein